MADGTRTNPYQLLRERILSPPDLGYNPARTARKQVSAVLKEIADLGILRPGMINLDLGGGPWNLGTQYLADIGLTSVILDPYAQPRWMNQEVLDWLETLYPQGVDTVSVGNVLNVLESKDQRLAVVSQAHAALKEGGIALFTVYEGDRSGQGGPTRDGWQANLPRKEYLTVITSIFGNVAGGCHKALVARKRL